MFNLLKAEFYKLFHSWYFWGISIFNLFLSSVMLLDSKSETSNLFFASLYNTPLLYFLTIVFAALFVGNDFEKKTLQAYISAGHRRGQILLAKVFAYQAASMIILGLPVLVHGFIGSFFLNETFKPVSGSLTAGVTIAVSLSAMCMLPFIFAFLFRDMGKTLAVPMILFFLMIFWMNGDQSQYVSQILPMGQLRLIALQQFLFSKLLFVFIDFLWIFVLILCAYVNFKYSDLK